MPKYQWRMLKEALDGYPLVCSFKDEDLKLPMPEAIAAVKGFNAKLYPFQKEAVGFLITRKQALLADEMGLGKTISVIAASLELRSRGLAERVLILCPKSIIAQWASEIQRFTGEKASIILGNREERCQAIIKAGFWVITNYETILREAEKLADLESDIVVLDEAQRIGCISGNTRIQLADGQLIAIKELYDSHKSLEIFSLNDEQKFIKTQATVLKNPELMPCIEIRTANGTIQTSENHRFLYATQKGEFSWVEAGKLKKGDLIAASSSIPSIENLPTLTWIKPPKRRYATNVSSINPPITVTHEFAELIGWQISEGCESSDSRFAFSLHINEKFFVERILVLLENSLGLKAHSHKIGNHIEIYVNSQEYALFLHQNGYPVGMKAKNKTVPSFIMKSPNSQLVRFIQTLFLAEGTVSKDGRICFGSASQSIITQLQQLLQRFNIFSRVKQVYSVDSKKQKNSFYHLTIGGIHVKTFAEKIGLPLTHKKGIQLKSLLERPKYTIRAEGYPIANRLKELRIRSNLFQDTILPNRVYACYENGHLPSKKQLQNIQERYMQLTGKKQEILDIAINSDITFLPIIQTKRLTPNEVYDISVEQEPHNFLANGYIVHNSYNAQTTKQIKAWLNPVYRWALTGTPIENGLEELHSIMQWVNSAVLEPWHIFKDIYLIFGGYEEKQIVGTRNLPQLHEQIGNWMLRRHKRDVLKDLPPVTANNYYVELNDVEMETYDLIRERLKEYYMQYQMREGGSSGEVLAQLTYLRECCDSLALVTDDEEESSKLEELLRILDDLGEVKAVIFTEYERMLHIIQNTIPQKSTALYGALNDQQRVKAIETFREDSGCKVFLSTEAGGLGVNLQVASTLVNYDLHWNPARLQQRIGRLHRIGQKDTVTVINLIVKDSIEERVLGVINEKSNLFRNVVDGDFDSPNHEQIIWKILDVEFRKAFYTS